MSENEFPSIVGNLLYLLNRIKFSKQRKGVTIQCQDTLKWLYVEYNSSPFFLFFPGGIHFLTVVNTESEKPREQNPERTTSDVHEEPRQPDGDFRALHTGCVLLIYSVDV